MRTFEAGDAAYWAAHRRNQRNVDQWIDSFFPRTDLNRAERLKRFVGGAGKWVVSRNVLTYHQLRCGWQEYRTPQPSAVRPDLPAMRAPSELETIQAAAGFVDLQLHGDDALRSSQQDFGVVSMGWLQLPVQRGLEVSANDQWKTMEAGICANPGLLARLEGVSATSQLAFAQALAGLAPPEDRS